MSTFEVEVKFPVTDLGHVESQLEELGGIIEVPTRQVDVYYSHPCRDFAQTDEALRIRRVGDKNFITYKGPKVDSSTKTRREVEVPFMPGRQGNTGVVEILESLGFVAVAEVAKNRRKSKLQLQGFDVEVALDEVMNLGTYVELEISTEPEQLEPAKTVLNKLSERLGLTNSERRSYLEMLLGR